METSSISYQIKLSEEIIKLNKLIDQCGGKLYIVGGFVRDSLLGQSATDYDCEVYYLKPEDLLLALNNHGYKYKYYQKHFVISLSDYPIDISFPKTEKGYGKTYQDVEYELRENLSLALAAKRRDLTINAIYYDVTNGQLIDPYQGIEHLKQRIAVTINPFFAKDPVRILRLIYYSICFNLQLSSELKTLIKNCDFSQISSAKLQMIRKRIITIEDYKLKSRMLGIEEVVERIV